MPDLEFDKKISPCFNSLVHVSHTLISTCAQRFGGQFSNIHKRRVTHEQDILDYPRASDAANEFTDADGKRLVQDYSLCEEDCLDPSGRPRDMFDADGNPAR